MTKIYRLADRNVIVRNVSDTSVLYDVVFTKNDQRDTQTLCDEFPNLPLTALRNPQRNLTTSLPVMAVRLAQQGHYMSAPTVASRKAVYKAVSSVGISL